MAAAAAAGIGSAVGGIISAKMSSDAQKKQLREMIKAQTRLQEGAAAEREAVSQRVSAEAQAAQNSLASAETARAYVSGMLGAPGTYGPNATPTTGLFSLKPLGVSGIATPGTIPGGLFGTTTKSGIVTGEDVKFGARSPKYKGTRTWEDTTLTPDAANIAESIMSQPAFSAVSGMVAEANQLMNRQGPLWNELNNAVTGSIFQGAAALQRQQMEEISRMAAAGGTARSTAMTMAAKMRAQEQVNTARTNALWQAKLALEDFRNTAAQQNIAFASAWVDNQAGIRDSFNSALNQLQTFWSSAMAPNAIQANVQATGQLSGSLSNAYNAMSNVISQKYSAIAGAVQSITGSLATAVGTSNVSSGVQPGAATAGSTAAALAR